MKFIFSIISIACFGYLLAMAALYFFQRSLLYFPVAPQIDVSRQEITLRNGEMLLNGWVLNPGKARALIYFGGNAEDITNNINQFEISFEDYTVYLINYRGYGKNKGKPTQDALFSDAIAIYQEVVGKHQSISLLGRSLGSGVAVYLASRRKIEKLILLTAYDSIADLAQTHYPFFPTRYLVRDRFESSKYAADVSARVLIVAAELDTVVPLKHTLSLRDHFPAANVSYSLIQHATHNDVTDFPQYHDVLNTFLLD